MEFSSIQTDIDYRAALRMIESLMSARAGTPEGERLDTLVTKVQDYECLHFPIVESENAS